MRHPDAQLQCKSSDVCLDVCYRMLCVCVGKYVDKCTYVWVWHGIAKTQEIVRRCKNYNYKDQQSI